MAISTTISIRKAANKNIPSSYVPTTLPTFSDPQSVRDTTTITASLVDDSTEVLTLGNVVTQLTSYLNASYYPNILKLDALKTITVGVEVESLVRTRTANDLVSGTEVFEVVFVATWE